MQPVAAGTFVPLAGSSRSSQPAPRTLSVPDCALAEAAAWIARLHGPERSQAVELGWKDWFGAHPDHAAAWELVSDQWNKSHDIPVSLVHTPVRRRSFRSPFILISLGLAAGLGGLAVVSTIMFLGRGMVTTAVGEQRTLNLHDGTRIELNTATRLLVKYDAQARAVDLKSGEAYFSVAHERRPFVVMAGSRKVIAVGTSFTVRRDQSTDDSMTVTLIEGRVVVAPASAPNALPHEPIPEVTVLSAGERLQVRRHLPVTVDTPSIDRVTGWMRGQLVFDHTPLSEAVQELNRYSAIRLSLASPETGQIPVSGTFRVSDSASFAEAAAQTYGLGLVLHGGEIVLEPARESPQG